MANEERTKKAEFFHKVSLHSYETVLTFNSAIDTKFHNALNLVIGLVPILFGVFYYLLTKVSVLTLSTVVLSNIGYGVIMFVGAMIVGLWGYRPADFNLLHPYVFVNEYKKRELPEIMEITVARIGQMTDANWKTVNRKAFLYRIMLLLMMFGSIGFSLGFMFLLASIAYPSV